MTELKLKNIGSWTSLVLGGLIGLPALFFGLLVPAAMFGEGLLLMMAAPLLLYPCLNLVLSLLIVLWFAGGQAAGNLAKGQDLLVVSFKYSLTINLVIWFVFYLSLVIFVGHSGTDIILYLIIVLALIGIILSPFTIGLLICFLIKRKIAKPLLPEENLGSENESEVNSETETDESQALIKRYSYMSDKGELIIEQKIEIPSSEDKAYLNGALAPSAKYKVGESQFVLVSNGYIYAVRGFREDSRS